MPSYVPPQKGVEYITYVTLISQANIKVFQSNPTLAAGDVTVTTDGNAVTNLDTLPVVDPAGSVFVKVTVSATEMNGANTAIRLHDVAGAEWCDLGINIQTSAATLEGLEANIRGVDGDTLKHLSDQLDTAQDDLDDLVARLTAVRAGYLDELSAVNLPADVDTLLARLSAARALLLDEITAARMSELDAANLPADIDTLIARLTAVRAGYLDNLSAGAVALEATLTAIGLVVVAIDARLPADPADQSLVEAHVTAEVDDLITRVKGLNAIYDSVALRALEATLTDIKGAGWTNETLKLIKELVDELESGEKPPPRASFRM